MSGFSRRMRNWKKRIVSCFPAKTKKSKSTASSPNSFERDSIKFQVLWNNEIEVSSSEPEPKSDHSFPVCRTSAKYSMSDSCNIDDDPFSSLNKKLKQPGNDTLMDTSKLVDLLDTLYFNLSDDHHHHLAKRTNSGETVNLLKLEAMLRDMENDGVMSSMCLDVVENVSVGEEMCLEDYFEPVLFDEDLCSPVDKIGDGEICSFPNGCVSAD